MAFRFRFQQLLNIAIHDEDAVKARLAIKDGQIADSEVEQADQALQTIKAALEQGGAGMADVVRVVVYVTDAAYFQTVGPVLGKYFKATKPANTTIVCGLVDPRMKVEIEVTALKG